MALTRAQIQELCTKPELALVQAAQDKTSSDLSEARLKAKVDRARALRDKYRDLAKSQKRTLQARAGSRDTAREKANARTTQKAELFEQTLKQFQELLKEKKQTANGSSKTKAAVTSSSQRSTKDKASKATPKTSASAASSESSPRVGSRKKKKASSKMSPSSLRERIAKKAERKKTKSEHAKQNMPKHKFKNTRSSAIQGHVGAVGRRRQGRRDAAR